MRSMKQSPLWVFASFTKTRTERSRTYAICAWSNIARALDLLVWTPLQLNVTHLPEQFANPSSAGETLN